MFDVEKSVSTIIDRMKKLRESKKMSQLELSLASGVSQTMISQIESRQRIPTLVTFLKLCDALDVVPELLLGNVSKDDEKHKDKQKILNNLEEVISFIEEL